MIRLRPCLVQGDEVTGQGVAHAREDARDGHEQDVGVGVLHEQSSTAGRRGGR